MVCAWSGPGCYGPAWSIVPGPLSLVWPLALSLYKGIVSGGTGYGCFRALDGCRVKGL